MTATIEYITTVIDWIDGDDVAWAKRFEVSGLDACCEAFEDQLKYTSSVMNVTSTDAFEFAPKEHDDIHMKWSDDLTDDVGPVVCMRTPYRDPDGCRCVQFDPIEVCPFCGDEIECVEVRVDRAYKEEVEVTKEEERVEKGVGEYSESDGGAE